MLVHRHSAYCRCPHCRTAPARRRNRILVATAIALVVGLSPVGYGLAAAVRDVLVQGFVR